MYYYYYYYYYGILIGAAVLAGPTDHATRSVTIGRIYVRTTAMQPEKLIIINCLAGFGYESFGLCREDTQFKTTGGRQIMVNQLVQVHPENVHQIALCVYNYLVDKLLVVVTNYLSIFK